MLICLCVVSELKGHHCLLSVFNEGQAALSGLVLQQQAAFMAADIIVIQYGASCGFGWRLSSVGMCMYMYIYTLIPSLHVCMYIHANGLGGFLHYH